MEIKSEGIIVNKTKFRESSAIVTVFTEKNGILKGVLKGGYNKKNFYKLQISNLADITWKARLVEHLGSLSIDLKNSYISTILHNQQKLLAVKTICELISIFLPERDSIPKLYNYTKAFFSSLLLEDFFIYYIKWELIFLKCLGYGLDFSKCGVCNEVHNIKYVSPKTGASVCEKVGYPYRDKLLILPEFFLNKEQTSSIIKKDKIKALSLTGYFIKQLSENYNKKLPISRDKLVENYCK